jgi:hypothetical protein
MSQLSEIIQAFQTDFALQLATATLAYDVVAGWLW